MAYLSDDFKNIRFFPANMRVYRDGIFVPEFAPAKTNDSLPLHQVHLGKITGDHSWRIDENGPNDVFLTARIETFGKTKIEIIIDSNRANLSFDGKIIIKNTGNLELNIIGNNNKNATGIRVETKLFAGAESENILSGLANIPAGILDAQTDISFAALCAPRVKLLKMSPAQRIASVPLSAGHSASIFRPKPAQIRYLETAGLDEQESEMLLNKVFLEEEA
jgi:hypothetical protein